MQVERPHALLQGPRYCQRALGSKVHTEVYGGARQGGVGGARREQEEKEDFHEEGG